MNVIVFYASRYGSTRGIAEFIAEKLREHGVQAEARSVDADPGEYDAAVIGSAVYMEHWMKEAAEPGGPSRGRLSQPERYRGLGRRHCTDAGDSLTTIEGVIINKFWKNECEG